jgi:hypothetical protein
MAATGALALVAVIANPGGGVLTRSPWLAQTRRVGGTDANSGAPGTMLIVASPNSRCGAGATSPPSACVINCMP